MWTGPISNQLIVEPGTAARDLSSEANAMTSSEELRKTNAYLSAITEYSDKTIETMTRSSLALTKYEAIRNPNKSAKNLSISVSLPLPA